MVRLWAVDSTGLSAPVPGPAGVVGSRGGLGYVGVTGEVVSVELVFVIVPG